ncbi:hypothetical protein OSB04_030917 [Centaurea solstitialis]|uniref:Reverse transcriptase n=1 Tax=Centaurea solstitialis TaxID=347529 RepID=A0AA38S7Z0_9ASTR|nr:hypothetical protein OSB04_030917 [Centaurea solstitialis]
MDDFSVCSSSFVPCLTYLEVVLQRCLDTNLVLSREKWHFMVTEDIVLGHKVFKDGIEVEKQTWQSGKQDLITVEKGAHFSTAHQRTRLEPSFRVRRVMQHASDTTMNHKSSFGEHKREKVARHLLFLPVISTWIEIIIYIDHPTLKKTPSQGSSGGYLLQEFDIKIRDKQKTQRLTDHPARLEGEEPGKHDDIMINESSFPDEQLFD